MTKALYFRLAAGNLWKNRQTYLPFLLATSLLTFSMYSFLMITFNTGLSRVHGGDQFQIILSFGIFVVGLFTAIFLCYANGFLIKRRKKELGLYSILGMEKRHVARVLTHELSLTWLASMAVGLSAGILLSRFLFLLIRLAMRVDVPLVGSVNMHALWLTLGLFAVLFLLLIGMNLRQVRSLNPIELLRGGQTGEREPKARWVLAVLGVAFTGAGYWMAQSVTNPMAAIALFFVAVILVILGTYLLFLTGSIALLKALRSNRRYYYRSRHFITVSGMLYRMKHNAAGLASIAILSTMAMITIGTTVALYNGSEKMLDEYYPNDMRVSVNDEGTQTAIVQRNLELAEAAGVSVTDVNAFHSYEVSFALEGSRVEPISEMQSQSLNDYSKMHTALILTEDEYTKMEGESLGLAAGEIACYTTADVKPQELVLGTQTHPVRTLDALPVIPSMRSASAVNSTYLIVPDEATQSAILDAVAAIDSERLPVYTTQWNVNGTEEALSAYYASVKNAASDWPEYTMRIKGELRGEWYGMHGGFLFVGIFLGMVFLMGTAIILYFKQISEGIQDHDRFVILQQVGMSQEEVRATVRRQILLVFFLPLAVAVCHVAGSLHMMTLMLRLFGLMDVPYIALNTFLAAFGVAALYGLFYHRTAKTYYRLVKF